VPLAGGSATNPSYALVDRPAGLVVRSMSRNLERGRTWAGINDRFKSIMDQNLPHWKLQRQELSSPPLGHETWGY